MSTNTVGAETPNKKMRAEHTASVDQSLGTIYITVGPQCSGKTTILKHIFGENFHKNEEVAAGGVDITIDDQALVYVPIPTCYFLQGNNSSEIMKYGIDIETDVLGKSIRTRINDSSNDELRSVIRRMGGQLNADEFALILRGKQTHQVSNNPVVEDLIAAVEDIVSSNDTCLPDEVDLFIVESIFRPRPVHLMRNIMGNASNASASASALDAALDLLKSHANDVQIHLPTSPIAWGKTKTRPREYPSALEAAAQSGRPVEFIVFGGLDACCMIREHMSRREYRKTHEDDVIEDKANNYTKTAEDQTLLCLPKISRLELFRRNLHRFSKTGRYIPSAAINDAMVRVESLLASAAAEAKKTCDPNATMTNDDAKYRLDFELAKLADFELNSDRTVRMISRQSNNIGVDRGANFERNAHYNNGRFGRGHSGRGRSYNGDFQGRHYDQGRHNVGRQPYFQQSHRDDRRQGQGRGRNNYASHGRNQGERTHGSQEYGGYNTTRYNGQGWYQYGGRGGPSNRQQQIRGYNSHQGRGRGRSG